MIVPNKSQKGYFRCDVDVSPLGNMKSTTHGPNQAIASSTARRHFNEVVKDHLLVAITTDYNGSINPVVTEWCTVYTRELSNARTNSQRNF